MIPDHASRPVEELVVTPPALFGGLFVWTKANGAWWGVRYG